MIRNYRLYNRYKVDVRLIQVSEDDDTLWTLELPEETKLFPFSALNKSGRDEIVEYIEEICDL